MPFPSVFDADVTRTLIDRINRLTPSSQPQWGKMSVDRMLAHLNVAYETIYEPGRHPTPGLFMKPILRFLVKPLVTGDKPLKRNSPTAPYFIIASERDFDAERARLIAFVRKTQELGRQDFDGKASLAMGALTHTQWSNMLYKHLDHHLTQFGV